MAAKGIKTVAEGTPSGRGVFTRKKRSLEDVFSARDPFWVEEGATHREIELHQPDQPPAMIYENKDIVQCGYLGDLGDIGKKLEIVNLLRGNVVRTITIDGDQVRIESPDADPPYLILPATTPVYYEEWFMDRGSYLFWSDRVNNWVKLATEYDPVKVMEG